MNNKPFSHVCHFGTEFSAHRCDFQNSTIIVRDKPDKQSHFISDVAEMIGFHAVNIRPELNGFSGYDCLSFVNGDDGTFYE